MAAIDSVYQYYLSTYGNEHSSRYDSHKKSDLRKTTNSIAKSNNESPLYKLKDEDGDVKRFAIDIKESARNIKNVSAEEAVLTDGKIDPSKLEPITYDGENHNYIKLGEVVGKAFCDGKSLM